MKIPTAAAAINRSTTPPTKPPINSAVKRLGFFEEEPRV